MSDESQKITIRPEDLEDLAVPTPPLRIDVPPEAPRGEPGSSAPNWVTPGSEPTPVGKSRTPVLLMTLAAIAAATITGVIVWNVARPSASWTERISATADRSVVRIDLGDKIGTGFVVASDGSRHLLLTNRHVVDAEKSVGVVLRTGIQATGTVAAYPVDDEVDLALVVVDVRGLRPLGRIASFASVRSGMEVAAVGHPLGLEYTITNGIISAKRGGMLLQTSTPINPGNSGGPLINRDGDIVGVNTMIVNPEHGQSLAFAFRADLLRDTEQWRYLMDVSDLLARVQY